MVSLMPTPWNDATRLVRTGVKGYAPAHTAAPSAMIVEGGLAAVRPGAHGRAADSGRVE